NISPIEAFRKNRGWSRGALARESGISYVTCNNIENGYILQISQNILEKLVRVGCPDDIGEQYILWRQSLSCNAANPEAKTSKEELANKLLPEAEPQLSEVE
ncbi:MAG: helix-turn-helix transcriptional regulator, partial [Synergistales bacterium]|nr:helix-turn-helix transcriptional regulator [Synergistales bacterium]